MTETAPPPQPKVEEKPVEKKPDPPKVVEKPREEPKQGRSRRSPIRSSLDPIAEAIKKEEKKPPPKPVQAAKPPEPPKPKIVERHLRSVADRGAARQARPVAPGRRRRHAEFERRARPRQGHGRGQFRDMGLRCSSEQVRTLLEEALWRHRVGRSPRSSLPSSLKRDGSLEGIAGSGRRSGDPYLRVYPGERACARSSNASRIKSAAGLFTRNGNMFTPVFRIKSDGSSSGGHRWQVTDASKRCRRDD